MMSLAVARLNTKVSAPWPPINVSFLPAGVRSLPLPADKNVVSGARR